MEYDPSLIDRLGIIVALGGEAVMVLVVAYSLIVPPRPPLILVVGLILTLICVSVLAWLTLISYTSN